MITEEEKNKIFDEVSKELKKDIYKLNRTSIRLTPKAHINIKNIKNNFGFKSMGESIISLCKMYSSFMDSDIYLFRKKSKFLIENNKKPVMVEKDAAEILNKLQETYNFFSISECINILTKMFLKITLNENDSKKTFSYINL